MKKGLQASDDSAGLAISDNLRARGRIQGTAFRNLSDGISLINIANSSLDQQAAIVQRMLELAEQSANGSYSSAQRTVMQAEYEVLAKEFGRLGDTTSFNGLNLLLAGRGGNASSITLQAGVTGDTSSTISVATQNTGTLSGTINMESLPTQSAAQNWNVGAWARTDFSLSELESGIGTSALFVDGVDAQGQQRKIALFLYRGSIDSSVGFMGFVQSLTDPTVWQNNQDVTDLLDIVSGNGLQFNAQGQSTGNTYNANSILSGLSLRTDFSGLKVSGSTSQGVLNSSAPTSVLEAGSLYTQAGARAALNILNSRLNELSTLRGNFGAFSSRLETVLAVVDRSRVESLAAESRIRDVDVASESAKLVASRIRQQTSTQILGLANQQPELVLSLLQF